MITVRQRIAGQNQPGTTSPAKRREDLDHMVNYYLSQNYRVTTVKSQRGMINVLVQSRDTPHLVYSIFWEAES